jgi:hypothetical protein
MTPESGLAASSPDEKSAPKEGAKPRAGVPVWRTGKPDAFLAAAVDVARGALEEIAPAEQIGRHLAAKSEGDRLVTHLFESKLAGYGGWQWYAVLTRNSRSKAVTVDELGLLPSEDSILAPDWIPWAERVRPGDEQGGEESADAPVSAAPDAGTAAAPADANLEADVDLETDVDEDAAEDDSDDADGNADGSGDEYDDDDVDDDDDDDDGGSTGSDDNDARGDGLPATQAD